jgi:hypothetical protein
MGSGQKIGMTLFGAEDRHGGVPSWYLSGESRRVPLPVAARKLPMVSPLSARGAVFRFVNSSQAVPLGRPRSLALKKHEPQGLNPWLTRGFAPCIDGDGRALSAADQPNRAGGFARGHPGSGRLPFAGRRRLLARQSAPLPPPPYRPELNSVEKLDDLAKTKSATGLILPCVNLRAGSSRPCARGVPPLPRWPSSLVSAGTAMA